MDELLTAAQMRAIERAAIESGEVSGLELMERAGRGVVEAIFEEWPELEGRGASPSGSPEYLGREEGRRAVVLCGPGNNGGDGFVVARLLKERGWEVEVFLYGEAETLPPDARVNYERWSALGEVGTALELVERLRFPNFDADNPNLDLFVDAVFGTGLARPIPKEIADIAASLNDREEPNQGWIVSIDIASGLCADSGRVIGDSQDAVFFSDLTVSFHSEKCGHRLTKGSEICGKTVVTNIGLREFKSSRAKTEKLKSGLVYEVKPKVAGKQRALNKFFHGHSAILSGEAGRTGASRLVARGALRVGSGLVTLASPTDALAENASHLTAVMLREVDDARTFDVALQDKRINALCLGPGMGLTEDKAAMISVALEANRAAVLDADALTLISRHPVLFEALHDKCVLTPHAGEFARLFPDISEKLNAAPTKGPAYSKVDATREAAKRAGCVVLFKGPDTVIAGPDGRCSINSAHYDRAAPWLATAGSGDVLAGFITGLLARGFSPVQAAETGAWLHVECALEFGPGLIAEDLPEMLPAVFRKLGL